MAVRRKFDFSLGGKGYMLQRSGAFKGRVWKRTGQSDAPARRSSTDAKWGQLPDTMDHPEVWDDWSGGFGNAYRDPSRPNVIHWSENMDTRFPRQAVHCQEVRLAAGTYASTSSSGGTATVNDRAEWVMDILPTTTTERARPGAGGVLLLGRQYFVRYEPTGGASGTDFERGFEAAGPAASPNYYVFTGPVATVGSLSYIPNRAETGTVFWERNHDGGSDFTKGSLTAAGFVKAGDRMWRWHGPYQKQAYVQNAPMAASLAQAANYSATLTVGNGNDPIISGMEYNDQVFFGLADGLYAGDTTGTFYNVLSGMRNQRHVDNCREIVVHNQYLVTQHVSGVFAYQQNDFVAEAREIGPSRATNRSPVRGIVRALRSHGDWLYAGLWSGSGSYLLAGREEQSGRWAWHVQQRIPHNAKISRLHVDGITVSSGGLRALPNRMWALTDPSYGSTAGATAPYYFWPIPLNNANPLGAEPGFSANYMGSARMDMGAVDWGAPGTPKVFRSVEVWADNLLSGAQYGNVYYTVDSGARTLLGLVAESPKSTLYFPSNEGSFTTGQSIELGLESFTASFGVTPVYRSIVLRGALRPKSVDEITAVVRIADNLADREGAPMRPGATMLQELRDLSQQSTPVQLIDLAGATQTANVLAPIEEQDVWQEGTDEPELAAVVHMAVLSYSGQ